MTPMESIQSARSHTVSAMMCRSVRVCWTSRACLNGHRVRRFMVAIELLSRTQAEVEAWVEHGSRASDRVAVLDRQTCVVESAMDEGLLHIDVFGSNGDGRIAAISLVDHDDHQSAKPLYVSTSLLIKAGFLAGRYDPPSVNMNARASAADRERSG